MVRAARAEVAPTTTWSPPASATRSATSSRPPSAAPASTTGSSYVTTDPALVRPADATDLTGDATRARTVLGWEPTVDFEELVGRMVDADLPLLSRASEPETSAVG